MFCAVVMFCSLTQKSINDQIDMFVCFAYTFSYDCIIKNDCHNILFDIRRDEDHSGSLPRCFTALRRRISRRNVAPRELPVVITVISLSKGPGGEVSEAQKQKIKKGMRLVQVNARNVRTLPYNGSEDDFPLILHRLLRDSSRPMRLKFETPIESAER